MLSVIEIFRRQIQDAYVKSGSEYADFGEILCYEIHSQPDNPRGSTRTGLTFKELAEKWEISVSFLGELIADHCRKL